MKRTTIKMMAGTVAMACLTLGAGGLHAQVTQVLTISATASVQGAYSSSYNAKTGITTYTYAAPTKFSIATKNILTLLAADYHTTFPTGAKLAFGSNGDIEVLDKTNNVLQDVSGIMSTSQGTNDIFSGKGTSQYNGLGTSTDLQLVTITFDDTGMGGNLKIFLTGIGTFKTTDSTPNKTTGAYTETDSGSLSSNPFVCTGTAKVSGKATLTFVP
jgi:hypothetical protein